MEQQRIERIGPRPEPAIIPAIKRTDGSTEKRRGQGERPPRKRRETVPDLPPPPDDGRPHIDVRV